MRDCPYSLVLNHLFRSDNLVDCAFTNAVLLSPAFPLVLFPQYLVHVDTLLLTAQNEAHCIIYTNPH